MRLFHGAILVTSMLLVAGCSRSPTIKITFTEYKDPDGKFSILMPATPDVKKEKSQNPYGDSELGKYVAIVDTARFIVEYEDYPTDFAREQGTRLLEGAVPSGRRSGAFPVSASASVMIGSYGGMDYEMQQQGEQPPRNIKGRLVLVNNRIYDIVVESLPGTVPPAEATKFLESFKPSG